MGTTIVWICMLIVALPLSPCAFFSNACCQHEKASPEAAAANEACANPERACCAHHSESSGQSKLVEQSAPQHSQQPCKAECCRLSPFVPPVVKVAFDAQPLALAVALPQPIAVYSSPLEVPSLPLAAAPPLQILHCQWRL
jgi:hypothetical protein